MARLSRASVSDSGGGPGGEEAARRPVSVGAAGSGRLAEISLRNEATSRSSSENCALVAAGGSACMTAMAPLVSELRCARLRRLYDLVGPWQRGTEGAVGVDEF
jgi:hypothetical protein